MNSIHQLEKGKTYRVKQEFRDYDNILHNPGKEWVFIETTFLPYHSGLSLFVMENGERKQYRFQQVPEEQEALLANFMDYIETL